MEYNNIVIEKIKPLLAKLIHNFLTAEYNQRRESAIALSKFKGEKATDFLWSGHLPCQEGCHKNH